MGDLKFSSILVTLVLMVMFKNIEAMDAEAPTHSCGRRSADYDESQLEQSFKELLMTSDSLQTNLLNTEVDPTASLRKSLGGLLPMPIVVNDEVMKNIDSQKSLACSRLECTSNELLTPVCSCNYNTGNVVTFKNQCELKKHNCRFNTAFHAILNEICPWEFQSRRANNEVEINYDDPKYYN